MMTRRQSAPSVRAGAGRARARRRVPIVAPMPSNSPEMPRRRVLVLLRREVRRVRVVERLEHPLDRALDERLAVDVAAGVAVGDRAVGVPERLEGVGSRRRACPASARLAAERVARQEQRAAGEDRDDGQGATEHAGAARGRPGAGWVGGRDGRRDRGVGSEVWEPSRRLGRDGTRPSARPACGEASGASGLTALAEARWRERTLQRTVTGHRTPGPRSAKEVRPHRHPGSEDAEPEAGRQDEHRRVARRASRARAAAR